MKLSRLTTVLLILTFSFLYITIGCVRGPEYPDNPEIKFLTITPNIIDEVTDPFTIIFSFQDGDGDLGSTPIEKNIFVTDNRTGFIDCKSMESLTPGGSTKAISGEIELDIFAEFCRCDWEEEFDTVYYYIRIRDRAGHFSNIDSTSPLLIRCNYNLNPGIRCPIEPEPCI